MNNATEISNKIISILSKNDSIKERYKEEIDWLKARKEKWNNNKIRVGIIGITSSGKSTLINAIIGKKILSAAVAPSSNKTTSCLYGDKEKLIVYFEDGAKEEYNDISDSITQDYNDERFNAGNKNKVEFLEIYTPEFSLDKDIELIDSPGLGAYNHEDHDKVTLEALLPTIDICIFVTTLKNSSDEYSKEIINTISKKHIPIIIVQNMLDSVKPRLDKKKSALEVAEDHKIRLLKIIKDSNIKNENLIDIFQLSSSFILDKKLENKEIDEIYDNYFQNFVKGVNKFVEIKKPGIDNSRLDNIFNKFNKLVESEKEALNNNINYDYKFQYDGFDEKIEEQKNKLYTCVDELFKNFDYKELNTHYISDDNDIEYKVNKVKEAAKIFENGILESVKEYNEFLSSLAEKLNIDFRDISFNQVNVGIYNIEIKKINKTVKEWKKKEDFFSKVKQFFDFGKKHKWGQEEENKNKIEINREGTEENIRYYIDTIKSKYSNVYKQLEQVTLNLELELDKERESYENKKKNFINEKEIKDVIDEIYSIISDIKNLKSNYKSEQYDNIDDNIIKEKYTYEKKQKTAGYEYYLNNFFTSLSEFIIYKFNDSVMNSLFEKLMIGSKYNNTIIGWDNDSIAFFIKRFWNIEIVEEDNISISDNNGNSLLKILYKPESIMDIEENNNIFIMVSAQIGYFEEVLEKLEITKNISSNQFLFFVLEDFDQVINGRHISDMILELLLLKNKYKKTNSFILINSENPIYNLAIIENQLKPCRNQSEESDKISEIIREHSHLIRHNSAITKNIADILKVRMN